MYRRYSSRSPAVRQTFWTPELDKLERRDGTVDKNRTRTYLSYALFPQVATEFFKYRQAQETKVDETAADTKNGAYPV